MASVVCQVTGNPVSFAEGINPTWRHLLPKKKMNLHVHLPVHSQLREYITVIWEVLGKRDVQELILPQGIVEIVFNFSGTVNGVLPHTQTVMQASRCFIQGLNTYVVRATYVGQHHLFGVRLQPHMVHGLLGILPAEVKDTTVDLTLIKPEFNRLWHQLIEVASFEERVQLVEKNFPVLTQSDGYRSQRLTQLFLSESIEPFQTVDTLAGQVYYSPRHLNRIVHNLYGVSAEELVVYKKFMQSVKLIHQEDLSLTQVAYMAGFYDQSHFCRIFKLYTGITPKQYRSIKSEVPFHIIS
jgi:AraC-like DNA-binding protein